jgi:hypothetical protein
LVAGVWLATVLVAAGTWSCASNQTPERNFTTLADARQGGGFEPGWLPESRVPPSGRNLRERRDLRSNELWARFEFDDGHREALVAGCRAIGQQELRLPASETRGIGWWPEMLRSDPAVAVGQFEIHDCTDAGSTQPATLALHRSLTTAFYWRAKARS